MSGGSTTEPGYETRRVRPPTPRKSSKLGMRLNCIWWWGSRSENRGNVESIFIAITFRSNPTRNDSISCVIYLVFWLVVTPGRINGAPNETRTHSLRFASLTRSALFANGPGDRGSIPGRVLPKTLKMVLDTSLLNTQHYKVRIKGKVDQCR